MCDIVDLNVVLLALNVGAAVTYIWLFRNLAKKHLEADQLMDAAMSMRLEARVLRDEWKFAKMLSGAMDKTAEEESQ